MTLSHDDSTINIILILLFYCYYYLLEDRHRENVVVVVRFSGLSVLLNRMQWPENSVAIDGSLYRYHPNLHSLMMAWIAELAPTTKVVHFDWKNLAFGGNF